MDLVLFVSIQSSRWSKFRSKFADDFPSFINKILFYISCFIFVAMLEKQFLSPPFQKGTGDNFCFF